MLQGVTETRGVWSSFVCRVAASSNNHLDLESITSLNNALIAYPEVVLFASHDHQFVSTVANRIVEITPDGIIDVMMNFDDYLAMQEASETGEEGERQRKAA